MTAAEHLADAAPVDQVGAAKREPQPRVLKEGDTFAVFNAYGDLLAQHSGEDGLFHDGTRYLSHYELRINGQRLLLLSSTVGRDDPLLAVDLTNPDFGLASPEPLPRERLHLSRQLFLHRGACHERLRIHNYHREPVSFVVQRLYDADYADIFEVRGARRRRRGNRLETVVERRSVTMAYVGVDGRTYRTLLRFAPTPNALTASFASHTIVLDAGEEISLYAVASCADPPLETRSLGFFDAYRLARRALRQRGSGAASLHTSNEVFNEWLERSSADLHMLTTDTPYGPYPYAGIPWFSTPFGRDGIITALQSVWFHPALTRGVLRFLAATQAQEVVEAQEAEPGKIIHEIRGGEMAGLGEVPFGRYYGSVDATPLFVVLAGSYFERTGDLDTIDGLWPNITAALRWIDEYGDRDGDGFVEYGHRSPTGLVNQGWKDSEDSVVHADGALAHGPIALCEVQAYVYMARRAAADMALALDQRVLSETLATQAHLLREQFEEAFWCEDIGTYALALDGVKAPCRVRSSNAGHTLFAGIASMPRARRVAASLMGSGSFSRWGIRTLDARERRYNPMSYHNGSIWPHDNALIALGLARYDLMVSARKLLSGLFDAASSMELHRLPELFCGFSRARSAQGPVSYPTACAPQAWASATVFCLLQACLGIAFEPGVPRLHFHRPRLPRFLQQVEIRDLQVGSASVDVSCRWQRGGISLEVLERRGQIEVLITK